jgi:hypothetical protein
MDKNDKIRFSEIMMGIADNFGGTISIPGIKSRIQALSEYSLDQIEVAGVWLLKNRTLTFPAMPTVKEFIDAIKAQTQPQISLGSRAEIQADIVHKKLRYEGRNAPIDFQDPITFKLMSERWRYPSWAATVKEAELTWWKKDFVKAYEAHGESAEAEAIMIEGPAKLQALAADTIRKIA